MVSVEETLSSRAFSFANQPDRSAFRVVSTSVYFTCLDEDRVLSCRWRAEIRVLVGRLEKVCMRMAVVLQLLHGRQWK